MRECDDTYIAGLPGGDSGDVVIQEAKGPQDPGVPVCVFPGPITRLLGGELPIPGPHPLEPDLQVYSCKYKSIQEHIRYVKIIIFDCNFNEVYLAAVGN